MSARPMASAHAGGATTEIVSVCPVADGWCALWRDADGTTIRKPVAALAVVVHRWPDAQRCEPLQAVIPLVGWPDSGAFELAEEAAFVGLLGPGEAAEA